MPALADSLARNDAERRRLRSLVDALDTTTTANLTSEGWTVSAVLVHLGFWDSVALRLLRRWAAGDTYEPASEPWFDDLLNEVLLDHAARIDPLTAGRFALSSAAAIDDQLTALGERAAELLVENDAEWLLCRYRHRAEHLSALEDGRSADGGRA